ncbi:26 heat shock protein, mitochondrial [Glycine soja]
MVQHHMALKNLQKRVCASSSLFGNVQKQRWNNELVKRFGSALKLLSPKGKSLIGCFPGGGAEDGFGETMIVTSLHALLLIAREFFPWGLGSALMQASENINRLLMTKEDVKITIDDGVLTIKGEHKEEKDDDEHWSSTSSYGYYNTSLLLPDDAKADDIKAELKDGVLTVTIPRTEKPKKDVKQVTVE